MLRLADLGAVERCCLFTLLRRWRRTAAPRLDPGHSASTRWIYAFSAIGLRALGGLRLGCATGSLSDNVRVPEKMGVAQTARLMHRFGNIPGEDAPDKADGGVQAAGGGKKKPRALHHHNGWGKGVRGVHVYYRVNS